jgi:DNA polymerase elongation subunit (family B)
LENISKNPYWASSKRTLDKVPIGGIVFSMYRNCVYEPKYGHCVLFTWDEDGNRIRKNVDYNPYLYTETSLEKYDAKSIFGNKLKKRTFKNGFDRNKFIKNSNINRLFGNIKPTQQFLIDKFWKENKKEEFGQYPLKIFFLDIEVFSPAEFPEEAHAKHPINLITIYDSINDIYRVFSTGKVKYTSKEVDIDNYIYTAYKDEKEMLLAFVDYWCLDYPDIVTAWNAPFDITYIINRLKNLFGDKKANELSPIGRIYERHRKVKLQGREQYKEEYVIMGITIIDSLEMFDKFNFEPVPNLQLGTIGELFVDMPKVEYDEDNLSKLALSDWNTFTDYNIRDVQIMVMLERKTNYLSVLRMLGYMGLTSFDDALKTVPIVTGYSCVNAYEENKIIPTFQEKDDWRDFAGGFVKEPIVGRHKYISSYDLNSLYPNCMITLNISPETKFGKIIEDVDNHVIIEDINKKKYKIEKDKFEKFVIKQKLSLAKNNVLFTQSKRGIFSKMVEEVYNGRVEDKNKIKEINKKLESEKNSKVIEQLNDRKKRLDIMQYCKKIYINSCYGFLANKYAPMGDVDLAEAVTVTCQSVIQQSMSIVKDITKKIIHKYGKEIDNLNEIIVYGDTDSLYITIKDLVESIGKPFTLDDGKVNPFYLKIVDEIIEPTLNKAIKHWGETELRSIDSRFEFKRESICDVALFLDKKKSYVLHVLNSEGFDTKPEKQWKYTGGKMAKAETPASLKKDIKEIVEYLILHNDISKTNDMYVDLYDKFLKLSNDDICLIQGLGDFEKWVPHCDGFTNTKKGMPHHHKAAYRYNLLVDELGLSSKYEKIKGGDKVKLLEIVPTNKYAIEKIAYKTKYPPEFEELLKVDKQVRFDKAVMSILEPFYTCMGYTIYRPNMQPAGNLFEVFS